jgi:hypothetical protein
MQIYIYTLEHPLTNEIRYIGISKNPKKRLWQHLYHKNLKTNNRKNNWIKFLLKNNLIPKLNILDTIEVKKYKDAFWLERYWIEQFKIWEFNLVNGTNGGEGTWGTKMSKKHKEAIIKANKERKVSDSSKKKMSQSRKELIQLNGKTGNQIINDDIALIIVKKLHKNINPKIIAKELNLKVHIITAIRDGRTFTHISNGKIKTCHRNKINENQEKEIIDLLDYHTNKEVCRIYSISEPTLTKIRKKYGKYTRARKAPS